jgi:hypothetical protein
MDVAKINLVFHMLQWDHLPQAPTAVAGAPQSGHRMSPQVGGACLGRSKVQTRETGCSHRRLDACVRPDIPVLEIPLLFFRYIVPFGGLDSATVLVLFVFPSNKNYSKALAILSTKSCNSRSSDSCHYNLTRKRYIEA